MILLLMLLLLAVGFIAFFIGDVSFLQEIFHYNDFPENLKDTQYQKIVGIVCWVLFLIVFLVVCCSRTEIQRCNNWLYYSNRYIESCCRFYKAAVLSPTYSNLHSHFSNYIFGDLDDLYPFHIFIEWNWCVANKEDTICICWMEPKYTKLYDSLCFWASLVSFCLWRIIYFFEALGAYWSASTVAIWYF